MKNTASKFTVWCWLAAASFLGGCITLYKGIDKMTNYYNSEYSSRLVNAYVGGDAYNYIINGTYATAFFVLYRFRIRTRAASKRRFLKQCLPTKPSGLPRRVQCGSRCRSRSILSAGSRV